jgi:hypothetical protein
MEDPNHHAELSFWLGLFGSLYYLSGCELLWLSLVLNWAFNTKLR